MREGFVEGDGATIHYLDWAGDGRPLLLLHATGFLSALWRPIADRLAGRYRVVAVDQRGHGDSDKPEAGYRFDTFAADLQRVIDALEIERPLAAGHSSGGTTIVVHAARYPGVLRRAVLIEPILPRPDWYVRPPGGRNPNSLAESARRRRSVWPDRDELFQTYRARPTFESWREDVLRIYVDEGTRERDDGQVELKCPPEIEAQFFEAVTRLDVWRLIPDVRMPALLLWGAQSHLHGRGLDKAAEEALPHARTVTVPVTSHFLPQERPDEVARLMEGFLAD
ncbi:MAG: alpha/beta hydrolase [Dehalococcoidia bacterium]|nr:alpha/beta hydrolase [Dehalococcoidia bacterium]